MWCWLGHGCMICWREVHHMLSAKLGLPSASQTGRPEVRTDCDRSVPSGRVGNAKDAIFRSNEHFREAVGERESLDVQVSRAADPSACIAMQHLRR